MSVRVLGIDPGSHNTGWGVVDLDGSELRHVASGVIRAAAASLIDRLAEIHRGIAAVIAERRPDCAALEAVFTHRNPRSAIQLAQARGAALAACGVAGLVAAEYAPRRVKVAVSGYGNADKVQVQRMVQRLLGLGAPPPFDAADALAVSICHSLERRSLERGSAARVRGRQQEHT